MYVVCYDIPETKVRNKIFKALKGYGRHKQYSVFECELTDARFLQMYNELMQIMFHQEGSIRFYDLCAECQKKTKVIGVEEEPQEQTDCIIL